MNVRRRPAAALGGAVVLGLVVFAAGCGGSSHHAYPSSGSKAFLAACEAPAKARGHTAAKSCACVLEQLEKNVSYEDFLAFSEQISLGGSAQDLPAKVKQDIETCQTPLTVPSSSMEPTLHCARPGPGCTADTPDRVELTLTFGPKRGDIMAFHTPPATAEKCGEGGVFIKRLIGLPGETVREVSGRVSVDGKPLEEPYVTFKDTQTGTWHVPVGQYFFLGDNRAQSCDSRQWGSVPRRNLIGKVSRVIRPG